MTEKLLISIIHSSVLIIRTDFIKETMVNINRLFFVIFGASLSFLGAAARAESNLGVIIGIPHHQSATMLRLDLSQESQAPTASLSPCLSTATIIYTTASHPGGNHHGAINEKTDGRGGRCYLDRGRRFYVIVAGLVNSQYGETFAIGPGVKLRILDMPSEKMGLSVDVGGELPFVHYAWGRQSKAINIPLPMLFAGINVKIGKVEVGMMQLWLPRNAARLRATVIDGTFDPLPTTRDQSHLPGLVEERPSAGPTLFIHYAFTSILGF